MGCILVEIPFWRVLPFRNGCIPVWAGSTGAGLDSIANSSVFSRAHSQAPPLEGTHNIFSDCTSFDIEVLAFSDFSGVG